MSFAQDVARLRRKLLAKGFTLKPTDSPVRGTAPEPPRGLQAALFNPEARQRLQTAGDELERVRQSLKTSLLCACGARTYVPDPTAPPTHCGLCNLDFDSPESQLARDIAINGRCIECGERPRSNVYGYCETCDPLLDRSAPMLDDDRPFLLEDEL